MVSTTRHGQRMPIARVMLALTACLAVWSQTCPQASAAEPVPTSSAPAHALAQKFAVEDTSTAVTPAPSRKPTPLVVGDASKPPAQKSTAQPTATAPPSASKQKIGPQRPSLEYEMEMLRRARAEEAARKAKDAASSVDVAGQAASQAPSAKTAPAATQVIAQPTAGTAPASPAAQIQKTTAPTPKKHAAPLAQTATDPVQLKTQPATVPKTTSSPTALQNVLTVATPTVAQPTAESSISAATAPAAQIADAKPAPFTATIASPPKQAAGPTQQATILLVLEPQTTSATSATVPNTPAPAAGALPDPIRPAHDAMACIGDTCLVSNGFETAAKVLARSEAQALKSTDGVTPDTCRGKIACIYRDVAVPASPRAQILDLGSKGAPPHGDGFTTDVDQTCRITDGELTCDHALATPDFRMWVVPEATAKKAGAALLEDALVEGLPQANVVSSSDK